MIILVVFDIPLLSWSQARSIQQYQGKSASPSVSLLARQLLGCFSLRYEGQKGFRTVSLKLWQGGRILMEWFRVDVIVCNSFVAMVYFDVKNPVKKSEGQ